MNTKSQFILVDDDSITNFLHEKLLRKLNVASTIIVKNNGKEALAYLDDFVKKEQDCPCIVMLDLNMPVVDGFEFIRQFKKKPWKDNIKVVIVTTSLSEKDIQRVRQFGDFMYINKPLTIEKLKGMVEKNAGLFEKVSIT
jgi:CheY-like chemotaxis protein